MAAYLSSEGILLGSNVAAINPKYLQVIPQAHRLSTHECRGLPEK